MRWKGRRLQEKRRKEGKRKKRDGMNEEKKTNRQRVCVIQTFLLLNPNHSNSNSSFFRNIQKRTKTSKKKNQNQKPKKQKGEEEKEKRRNGRKEGEGEKKRRNACITFSHTPQKKSSSQQFNSDSTFILSFGFLLPFFSPLASLASAFISLTLALLLLFQTENPPKCQILISTMENLCPHSSFRSSLHFFFDSSLNFPLISSSYLISIRFFF